MRFLIVDDGLGTPGTTASPLMADGHVVRVERGGFDAIGAAVNFKPDVVLIDFQSQVSSAYAVARTIRSANPSSKIIAVVESASIDVPSIFDLVLVKWFDYAALKQWVANHIEA